MNELPEITHAEILRRLQVEVEQAGSAASLARVYGISPRLMQSIMSGDRNIAPKMLRAMGLKRVTLIVHRYAPYRSGRRTVAIRKRLRGGQPTGAAAQWLAEDDA